MSSHSGLTKKSNIRGQGDLIASQAQQQFAGSPTRARTGIGKNVDFEDDLHSPDFNRGDLKDGLADDPKKRTDIIDKHLAG